MFKSWRSQKGFTLIELLIVIAILGILVAVVVPNVLAYRNVANAAAANSEAQTVQTAVYAYMADHDGAIPTSMGDLTEFISPTAKGVYTIGPSGNITGTSGWDGLIWLNGKWVRE